MADFSVDDIRGILKECRDTGVTRMKIGNFTVEFSPPVPKALEEINLSPEQITLAKQYQSDVFREHERRIREEELSNLRLSDPAAYEDLVNRGELDARKESDGTLT